MRTSSTPNAPFYWLLLMRVKLLSKNKEKNLPQNRLDPAPAALISSIAFAQKFYRTVIIPNFCALCL
jgi:hypothetical protein